MQVTHWHSGKKDPNKETLPPLSDSCSFSRENNRWRYPYTPPVSLLFLSPTDSVFPFEVREGRHHEENRRGDRTDIRPNNARRNFLSEIAVPNIIDNWYDTRLMALLEFYRNPTRERNCLSSWIAVIRYRGDIQGVQISQMPRIRQYIHCGRNSTVNSKPLTWIYDQ